MIGKNDGGRCVMSGYPIRLDHAGAWRVYLGGSQIRALRGITGTEDNHYPEEWIASVTPAAGMGAVAGAGLSRAAGDPHCFLRDLIAAAPEQFLGRAFCRTRGSDPGVLLKLLDAAERLNVQVHPDRLAARRLWNSPYGKTEGWYFLPSKRPDCKPVFYLGLKEYVTPSILRTAFESGDSAQLLACMHAFDAEPGRMILVDSGVPHALGAGCFALEIQEPSDLTLRLERRTASGSEVPDDICHMGIGYDAMFSMVRYEGLTREDTLQKYTVPPRRCVENAGGYIERLIDRKFCSYFQLERIEVTTRLKLPAPEQFYGLFALAGQGEICCGNQYFPVSPGDQFFVPASCPDMELVADRPMSLAWFSGPPAEA